MVSGIRLGHRRRAAAAGGCEERYEQETEAHSPRRAAARINEIARGRRGITADTALRLARFFGTSHQFWLNLQANYDVQCAEDEAGSAISKIKPREAA